MSVTVFVPLVLFVLGAVIASFIELVVSRLYTGSTIFSGRSQCDSCGRTLTGTDLVPVVSFAAMLGRCRTCGSRVSISSTVSELLLGSCFAFAYVVYGFSLTLPFFLAALAALLGIVRYDLKHTIIPPVFLIVFLLAAGAVATLEAPDLYAFSLVAGVAAGEALLLAGISWASKGRAMGMADAPLAFGLALLAGPAALAGFLFSFWIGALVGIIILVRTPRGARMGIEVPFAPFLAAGFLLALFTEWNPLLFISTLLAHISGAY